MKQVFETNDLYALIILPNVGFVFSVISGTPLSRLPFSVGRGLPPTFYHHQQDEYVHRYLIHRYHNQGRGQAAPLHRIHQQGLYFILPFTLLMISKIQ